MRVTRRFWAMAGFVLVFAGTAVVFDRPLLLIGATGLGAWVVGAQAAFVRASLRADRLVTVEQESKPERGMVHADFELELSVASDGPAPVAVTCTLDPPPSATVGEAVHCRLDRGDRSATRTTGFSPTVAGTLTFGRPSVVLHDPFGLFTTTVRRGSAEQVVVEPSQPRDLYVGRGGEESSAAVIDSQSGKGDAGVVPSRLREYRPGDAARRIDWQATARLGSLHVTEYDVNPNRQVAIVFDTRPSMRTGDPGRTKLDYARDVALAVTDVTEETEDPVGLYVFGDGGLIEEVEPRPTQSTRTAIRAALRDLAVRTDDAATIETSAPGRRPANQRVGASEMGWTTRLLERDDSAFARTVRPFFAARDPYIKRVKTDPLFAAVRFATEGSEQADNLVVITDDSRPTELYETVRFARQKCNVVVFLLPTVLFESEADANRPRHERFGEFEAFRQTIDDMPDVDAYEVGPRSRLGAILAEARDGRPHTDGYAGDATSPRKDRTKS